MYIDPQKAINQVSGAIGKHKKFVLKNLNWLLESMNPYFFITFGPEKDALLNLSMNLQTLGENHQLVLRDTDEKLIIATINKPGTLFKTLDSKEQRDYLFRNASFQHLSAGPGWRA